MIYYMGASDFVGAYEHGIDSLVPKEDKKSPD
jgi:hypothetical protein